MNASLKFKDEQLQKHFERTMALPVGNLPDEQRPIFALMEAYGWFRLTEGQQSPKVLEVIDLLLLSELRPGLRRWYQRFGDEMNPAVLEIREHLIKLAGEKFG
jgi:hypothetical protein